MFPPFAVKSIEDLSTIFKELAVLVIDQGTILDRIDFNMEQVRLCCLSLLFFLLRCMILLTVLLRFTSFLCVFVLVAVQAIVVLVCCT